MSIVRQSQPLLPEVPFEALKELPMAWHCQLSAFRQREPSEQNVELLFLV